MLKNLYCPECQRPPDDVVATPHLSFFVDGLLARRDTPTRSFESFRWT